VSIPGILNATISPHPLSVKEIFNGGKRTSKIIIIIIIIINEVSVCISVNT